MTSASLHVPVATWPTPLTHEVSALCPTRHALSALVTGSSTGPLCLWAVDSSCLLVPRIVLLGHTAPVVWIASCLFEHSEALVSLCSGGSLNVWDPRDGRCLCSASGPLLPTTTVGTLLPQLSHVVVGGESAALVVVQLSAMATRCVLSPLDGWCLAVATSNGSAEQRAIGTPLVCLTATSVSAWRVSIDASGAVDGASLALRCVIPPPPPLPPLAGKNAGRYAPHLLVRTRVYAKRRKPKRHAYDDEPIYESIGEEEDNGIAAETAQGAAEMSSPPPLAYPAHRHSQMSADASWLLRLSADGTLAVYALNLCLCQGLTPTVADGSSKSTPMPATPATPAASVPEAALSARLSPNSLASCAAKPGRVNDLPPTASDGATSRSTESVATVLCVLLRPSSAGCAEGWAGARLVRHGNDWAVIAWSLATAPTLFLLAHTMADMACEDTATAHAISACARLTLDTTTADTVHAARSMCASAVAAQWLPWLLRPATRKEAHGDSEDGGGSAAEDEGERVYAIVLADEAGDLHVLAERQQCNCGVPLESVGSAPLEHGWPEQNVNAATVSSSRVVAHEGVPVLLLLGHTDGSLSKTPLPGGLQTELIEDDGDDNGGGRESRMPHRCWAEHRHSGRVTDVMMLRNSSSDRQVAERMTFASASSEGEVYVWALPEMCRLRAFHQHASAVTHLMQPSAGVPLHMEPWFLAVAADGSISVYDVSPLLPPPLVGASYPAEPPSSAAGRVELVVLLNGHAEPVRELVWRPAEQMLFVRCSCKEPGAPSVCCNGRGVTGAPFSRHASTWTPLSDCGSMLYVWQLPAGRLSRVLYGAEARSHLHSMRCSPLSQHVPDVVSSREGRRMMQHASTSRRLVENVRVGLGTGSSPLHALIFNIKRLAGSAKKEAQRRENADQRSKFPLLHRRSFRDVSSCADAAAVPATVTLSRQDKPSFAEDGNAGAGGEGDTGDYGSGGDCGSGGDNGNGRHRLGESAGGTPSDVIACQSALSFLCCWGVDTEFDVQCRDEIGLRPTARAVTYGVRGHGSNFSFLTPRAQTRTHRWQCSSHVTALHSISAVALANTLMMLPGYDEVRNVCSLLVTHFSVALPERFTDFCAPSLSLLARHYVDSVEEVQEAARALLEGTIHRMCPEVRAQIVAAWAPRVLSLASSPPGAAAAYDLSSPQGVSVLVLAVLASRFGAPLEPAIGKVVVKQLLGQLEHPAQLHRSSAAELIGKGYHVWQRHVGDPPYLIRTLFHLSVAHIDSASGDADVDGIGSNGPQDVTPGTSQAPVLNRVHAALLAVGAVEPRHFCRAMGERAVQMGGSSAVRIAAVAAMISLVKARGTSLDADLPVVVNAVLRPLDPSVPQLREGCLAASTAALRELVKRYPMMSFHQGTQRLAVGTVEGVVVIYDLRTATKWRILQGHEKRVSALSFSSSGEYVASFAAEEQTLRWWLAGAHGFFGFLGLQGSCLHVTAVEQSLISSLGGGAIIGIEWTSQHAVTLTYNRQPVGSFTRPTQ